MTNQPKKLPSKEEAERIGEQAFNELFRRQLTPIEQLLQRIQLIQEMKERVAKVTGE